MEDRFVELLENTFERFVDAAIECGEEYKEIYDKQSDFAKLFFLGIVGTHFSKEDYLRIFSTAEAVEKMYDSNYTETN